MSPTKPRAAPLSDTPSLVQDGSPLSVVTSLPCPVLLQLVILVNNYTRHFHYTLSKRSPDIVDRYCLTRGLVLDVLQS